MVSDLDIYRSVKLLVDHAIVAATNVVHLENLATGGKQ